MAHLSYLSLTEIQLRLDAGEDSILGVVRKCPWWTNVTMEGHVPGSATASSVTLTTTRAMESTLRRILQMSFGLVFPSDGGIAQQRVQEASVEKGRKRTG